MNYSVQPVELVDCEVHGLGSEADLFVVEGDSAAKAVARVRDARVQAVLPMQGKPLNAFKATKKTVAANQLYTKLIEAIGAGWDDSLDCSKSRFDRILLLMDPDADGIHCGTLLLLFFYRWMRPLLDSGRIEVVRAPVMEYSGSGIGQREYPTSLDQCHQLDALLSNRGISDVRKQRFRGLASLSESALSTSCLNRETRVAERLEARDAEAAIQLFKSFRGSR